MKRTITINGKQETISVRGFAQAQRKVAPMVETPKTAYKRKPKHTKKYSQLEY